MNDEKTSTEAEQKKPGDMNASIERMIADLETIESLIRTTRSLVEGAEDGAFKWATLSKAIGDIRHVLGPCTFMPDECFHKVCEFASGKGAFHTPKEILDFVTANPQFGDVKDAPTPLDPSVQTGGGGGCNGNKGGFLHEQTRGCVHPLSHGDIAQVRRVWRDGIADGSEVAYETAFRQAA